MTKDQFRQFVLTGVERVGSFFEDSDDDWKPTLLLHTPKGLVVGSIDLSPEMKDNLVSSLTPLFQEHQPIYAGLVLSCWIRMIQADAPGAEFSLAMMRELGVSQDPKRQEMVRVEFCDGENTEYWRADINRFPDKPPTLGEWEEEKYEESTGRLSHVLQRTFDRAKQTS